MATHSDTLIQETDARFWAQTGYKPNQKLDPSIPTDKAMEPVWRDIYHKVKSEADAGKLVTTFDHPAVKHDLADAAVAHQAASAHADAAAASHDAATAGTHVAAAATAHQISKQKSLEAARKQPPTVAPALVKATAKEVAKNPPPPQAPAGEHIAHEHARSHAHAHARAVHAPSRETSAPSREALYKITNARFWDTTHYKPGQKLDMTLPQDVEMAKIWEQIFRQVQGEADAGTLVFAPPQVAPPPPQAASSPPPPMAPPLAPPLPYAPPHHVMPPYAPPHVPPPPSGARGVYGPRHPHPHHHHGGGAGQPGGAGTPAPVPGCASCAPPPGVPDGSSPSDEAPSGPPGPDDGAPSPPGDASSSGLSGGTIALIVLGVAVGGSLLYMGTSSRSSSRPRSRAPRSVSASSRARAVPLSSSALALPPPSAGRPSPAARS